MKADLAACPQVQKKLVAACMLCFIFMIVEVIGGYVASRWVVQAQTQMYVTCIIDRFGDVVVMNDNEDETSPP